MKKGIALIAYVYKTGIQSGHELLDLCHVDVADGERGLSGLVLIFHQLLVFEQGYGNFVLSDIDYYFACHFLLVLILVAACFIFTRLE